jgi:hypothetical protein
MNDPVLNAEPSNSSRARAMGGLERPNRGFKSPDRGHITGR